MIPVNIKRLPWVLPLLMVVLVACGSSQNKTNQPPSADSSSRQHEREYMEEVYICPMHPEQTGKKGDSCPKCGMALEPGKKQESDVIQQVEYTTGVQPPAAVKPHDLSF